MRLKTTARGFKYAEFYDVYDAKCSIQESSICYPACIWLGVDNGEDGKEVTHGRMHLSKKDVRKLIPHLQRFLKTGYLRK